MEGKHSKIYLRFNQTKKDWIKALVFAMPFLILISWTFDLCNLSFSVYDFWSWVFVLFLISPYFILIHDYSHTNERLCITERGIITICRKRKKIIRKYYLWNKITEIVYSPPTGRVNPSFMITIRASRHLLSQDYITENIDIYRYFPNKFSNKKNLNAIVNAIKQMCKRNNINYREW